MIMVSKKYFDLILDYFSLSISNALKLLLEEKHLYQSVTVPFPELEEIFTELDSKVLLYEKGAKASIKYIYESKEKMKWLIDDEFRRGISPSRRGIVTNGDIVNPNIPIKIKDIKIFCRTCNSIQPFNFKSGSDISDEMLLRLNSEDFEIQVLGFAFECQSCKSFPEIFIVRKEKMKIILSGRTPMEEVNVQNFIPKSKRKYFSDSIIAFNSGQILAGKFLLRTFIEQYVREITKNETIQDIDKLFEDYNSTLSTDFKNRFPSLGNIYSKLSVDIHKADGTPEIYIQSKNEIERHFDAKRLFEEFSN